MKKQLCTLLCIIMIFTLSGCWSRKEPKTLAIVNSIIYDILDNGMYQTTAELLNSSEAGGSKQKTGSSGKTPFITAVSEGLSPSEAIRNMSSSIERTVFGGHDWARFFSERLAKKDIASIIDYFLRDSLKNETPLMVVIKGDDPQQIYSSMLGLSDTVGGYMAGLERSQPNVTSKSVFVSTLDFVKDFYNDGKQPVMGLLELVESESKPSGNAQTPSQPSQSPEKKYKIKYEGLAAFKDNKLAGYMDGDEARAYNFITNKLKSAFVTIPSGEETTVVKIGGSNSNIKTTIQGEQVTIDVKIKITMGIIQESGKIDITKPGPLKTIEDSFDRQMQKEIRAAIKKAQQEFQSDIFGFGVAVHIQHPQKWKEIKENWDDYFSKAAINVTVDSSVTRSGEIKEPFEMKALS